MFLGLGGFVGAFYFGTVFAINKPQLFLEINWFGSAIVLKAGRVRCVFFGYFKQNQ